MASRDATTNVSVANYTANAACTAVRSHPSTVDHPPPPLHVTVPVSDAAGRPSNGDVENDELVFYEDHFSLDPAELCKLRFLSGDESVVDDLVQELEGSWQLILCESIKHDDCAIAWAERATSLVWSWTSTVQSSLHCERITALQPTHDRKMRLKCNQQCSLILVLCAAVIVCLCLGPGEVLLPEGVSTVEGQGIQCQENKDNTEEDFSDAEEDVNVELPLLDQYPPQDNSHYTSLGGHPNEPPHPADDVSQCKHQCTNVSTLAGGKVQSAKALAEMDSTRSPKDASHSRGATGVPVREDDFFKFVRFMHASNNRGFQSEYSVSSAEVL